MSLESIRELLPIIGGGGALGILEAARRIWVNSRRSKLRNPDAFKLPQVPESTAIYEQDLSELDHLLVGRERDTAVLTRILQENPLVFVDGPSGVGKSTLLKLGVARRLMQAGAWLPVYVDIWGADWVDGPRQALADALQVAVEQGLQESHRERLGQDSTVTTQNLWQALESLRAQCGRRPVLIFDQIDDYQNRHWKRFKGDDDALIPTTILLERNAFWMKISRLCRSGGVHIAFAVRSDASICLNSFHFREPKSFRLGRIESEDARSLIEGLVDDGAVAHPENGFEQLKVRIAENLQESGTSPGVLPIQLRVALSGLPSLPRLTPTHFEMAGGIEGLEAAYVERHARRTSGSTSKALSVLLKLVAQSVGGVHKTTPKDLSELVGGSQLSASEVSHVLEYLEGAQIVRRRIDPGRGEVWQLYHDYLARAVVRLDRKDREGEILLAENAKAFRRASGPWRKARTLLTPRDQMRVFKDKVRGRLVYGPNRRYALLSLPRLFINAPVLLVLLGLGGVVFGVVQYVRQEQHTRELLAESRLADAQVALRSHDIARAVESFGAVIDNLRPSDPRAGSAFAGIVANIPYAPRQLANLGPIWGGAVAVDADTVVVRRLSGQVEVFKGTTGQRLPAPDIGLLRNDFQWMNYMDRYPVRLSTDGKLASLVFPAGDFSLPMPERRPVFTLAVWRPGSEEVLWSRSGEDMRVSFGPSGYALVSSLRSTDLGRGCAWREEASEILRVNSTGVETFRLFGGTVASGFPETGEPFLLWQTSGFSQCPLLPVDGGYESREARVALVDVGRIPSGHSGQVPQGAVLWEHSVQGPLGSVTWQGRPGEPAVVVSAESERIYCDSSSCRPVAFPEHEMVSYATPPTHGLRLLRSILDLVPGRALLEVSPWGRYAGPSWAQGPRAETISFVRDGRLRVRDLALDMEGPVRGVSESLALAWSAAGSDVWSLGPDGRLVTAPVRGLYPVEQLPNPPMEQEGTTTTLSPTRDRLLVVQPDEDGQNVRVGIVSLEEEGKGREAWSIQFSETERVFGQFSVDGSYVILKTSLSYSSRGQGGNVRILLAHSGAEHSVFTTSGWELASQAWVGRDRVVAFVERFPEGATSNTWAVCELNASGLSRCSGSLERPGSVSRNGKYFIVDRVHSTEVYAASGLAADQLPVLVLRGAGARMRLDRAILEFLVRNAGGLSLRNTDSGGTQLGGRLGDSDFVATFVEGLPAAVQVGSLVQKYPEVAAVPEDGRWGPEVTHLEMSPDGRRIIVGSGSGVEVWDVTTGTVVALLPVGDHRLAFSDDSKRVQLMTSNGLVDILYLGKYSGRAPTWASGSMMSALVGGEAAGSLSTLDVWEAIERASRGGDAASVHVLQAMKGAWRE